MEKKKKLGVGLAHNTFPRRCCSLVQSELLIGLRAARFPELVIGSMMAQRLR